MFDVCLLITTRCLFLVAAKGVWGRGLAIQIALLDRMYELVMEAELK
jgi:hypothetical protein